MDVLGEIEAKINEADDSPSPKTSNKVRLSFSSLNKMLLSARYFFYLSFIEPICWNK